MIKFPSIESFHNVRRHLPDSAPMEVTYRAKVKLHGTNAGIRIKPNGEIFAQSRTRTITPGDDNMQFAAWVEENKEAFASRGINNEQIIVFGEWCGAGIMKNVAISKIDRKVFAIFAVLIGTDDYASKFIVDPNTIYSILDLLRNPIDGVYVLPWYNNGEEFFVNYDSPEQMQKTIDRINERVAEVEKCDPWVKNTFDIEGLGEGLVFVPHYRNGYVERWQYSSMTFKAKGDKHKVVKQKKAVQLDPEVVASIDEFVDLTVTPARLEQGVREISGGEYKFDNKLIGPFIGWIGQDVKKESSAELTDSGLEWKQVSKAVSTRAREWYLAELQKI